MQVLYQHYDTQKKSCPPNKKPVGVLFGNTFNLIMLFLACQTMNQKELKFFFRQLNGKSCLFAIVASNKICMLLIFMCCCFAALAESESGNEAKLFCTMIYLGKQTQDTNNLPL